MHIRWIQKYSPGPIISQLCPAIVNYITMHKTELIPRHSPVHSPMLCAAIFMKKYMHVEGSLASLSPCIKKQMSSQRPVLSSTRPPSSNWVTL